MIRVYRVSKRIFDIFCSVLGIMVTSPLWVATIIGIEISNPGPVFYKAIRIGYQGKEFRMYKFRSMSVPKKESEKSETSFKADTDRIFPFGKFIRKVKLDELPQLLNILCGTMSIVGPRPAAKDQVEIMREGKYAIANSVRPGLTGPAALYDYIYGDAVEDLEDYKRLVLPTRRELEAYYPEHMSAGYDIKMIWWTVVCIICSVIRKNPEKIYNELQFCGSIQEKPELQPVAES